MKQIDIPVRTLLPPRQERRVLTCGDEPALELELEWLEGGPDCPRALARLLRRGCTVWRDYWQRRAFPLACGQLGRLRAASRPFEPWQCRLTTAATCSSGGLLCVCWQAEQRPFGGPPARVVHTLVWDLAQGCLRTRRSLLPGGRAPGHRLSLVPDRRPLLVEEDHLVLLEPRPDRDWRGWPRLDLGALPGPEPPGEAACG